MNTPEEKVLNVLERYTFKKRKAVLGQENLAILAEVEPWRMDDAVTAAAILCAKRHPGYSILIDRSDWGYSIQRRVEKEGQHINRVARLHKSITTDERSLAEFNLQEKMPGDAELVAALRMSIAVKKQALAEVEGKTSEISKSA